MTNQKLNYVVIRSYKVMDRPYHQINLAYGSHSNPIGQINWAYKVPELWGMTLPIYDIDVALTTTKDTKAAC